MLLCFMTMIYFPQDNVGFTGDGVLKLMDFGLCICIKRRSSSTVAYKMTGEFDSTYFVTHRILALRLLYLFIYDFL